MRIFMDRREHPPRYCPHCHHQVNSSTQFFRGDSHGPAPGDVAFCFYCGGLSAYAAAFNEVLVLVALPPEREAKMNTDPRIIAMRAAREHCGPAPL